MTPLYPLNVLPCQISKALELAAAIKFIIINLLHDLTGSESKSYLEPLLTVKIKWTFEGMAKLVVKTYPTVYYYL